jgi:hypothetical protein
MSTIDLEQPMKMHTSHGVFYVAHSFGGLSVEDLGSRDAGHSRMLLHASFIHVICGGHAPRQNSVHQVFILCSRTAHAIRRRHKVDGAPIPYLHRRHWWSVATGMDHTSLVTTSPLLRWPPRMPMTCNALCLNVCGAASSMGASRGCYG